MISKTFYIIFIISHIKFAYCHKFKNTFPNILRNNNDLEELKKILMHNGGTYESKEGMNKSWKITYKQIVQLQEDFDNYVEKHPDQLTVKHFYLFTRDYHDGEKYELLDPLNVSSIKNSHFQTRPTFILVHGFLGYGLEAWVLNLKDSLLKREDCNVISVDWPAGSRWWFPSYLTATGKVPLVGNDTAFLIDSLKLHKGLVLETIHEIGHSLGAHICGFSAKPFLGRIGRISGLDPAGPNFHNLSSSQRLDRSDAKYVDVIHTNACNKSVFRMDCFGLDEDIGHSNFYPNGGRHQPACSRSRRAITGDIGCDHEMAYMYYIASFNFSKESTYFLSRPCDDWILFEIGNCSCGKNAQFMGFNVNTELDGIFYLETLDHYPFAMKDSDCPVHKQLNILIIIGYAIVGAFVLCCVFSVLFVLVENLKQACCSRRRDEEESLVSSDDSDEEEETTAEEEESENTDERRGVNALPNGGFPSVIST